MKLFNAEQIRLWDQFTIKNDPIASIDLMERAAKACFEWIKKNIRGHSTFHIFCGHGNNGGDGLAIARLLSNAGYKLEVYLVGKEGKGTADFNLNLTRLADTGVKSNVLTRTNELPELSKGSVVIDALLGSGISREVEGFMAEVIEHINSSKATVVSIDVPSGLPVDPELNIDRASSSVIKAHHTLTFQQPKLNFLFSDTGVFAGSWEVLDIGLHQDYYHQTESQNHIIDEEFVRSLIRPRSKFSYKNTHGHALIIGGSFGMMGAPVLSAKACMRTGAGLVTAFIPKSGYTIMQTALPEVMVICDDSALEISRVVVPEDKFKAIGIGPGLGTHPVTIKAVSEFISMCKKPLVIDADGLNICSIALVNDPQFKFPVDAILTPHPGELDRLAGASNNDHDRFLKARQFAVHHNVYVLLKGAHSVVCTPEGKSYFNSSGNPGMATAGSGDVLTGMITSLLAQGHTPVHSAVAGMFIHGYAGDHAAGTRSQESMIASDIIENIGSFFLG